VPGAELPIAPASLAAVHEHVAALFDGAQVPDDDRYRFTTAVAEVAANIIEHSSSGTSFSIVLDLDRERIEATFEDDAEEVDPTVLDRPMPEDFAERGRGMAILRGAVDEVRYERLGDRNRWTLIRWLRSAP
jgi:serine/threonine-protein kinase RsbW